jgi:hypothetical protein
MTSIKGPAKLEDNGHQSLVLEASALDLLTPGFRLCSFSKGVDPS